MFNHQLVARVLMNLAVRCSPKCLVADGNDYRYDPEHKHKPQGGGWIKTEKGWSKVKKEKPGNGGNGGAAQEQPLTDGQKRLVRLSRSQKGEDRLEAAHNSNTPASALAELAKDKGDGIRRAVAFNSNTPASALAKLAKDWNSEVRIGVAENYNTPASALARLAEDEDMSVRRHAAGNKNTPASALAKLAKDWNPAVRNKVAENHNTPASVLVDLAKDEHWFVRCEVAENPFATRETLQTLKADESDRVAFGAKATAITCDEVARFKKSLGAQNHRGRDLQQLKADFIRNMNPSVYESPEAFAYAQERVKKLSPAEFGMLMKAVVEEDEGI
ncbi:MAG: HEAT repeat domain-containing protein [Victivallales bacterium]|nr:HEAT repeat domain-containing protein [Victivallales bacterium]